VVVSLSNSPETTHPYAGTEAVLTDLTSGEVHTEMLDAQGQCSFRFIPKEHKFKVSIEDIPNYYRVV
jgi:hypothetical protein